MLRLGKVVDNRSYEWVATCSFQLNILPEVVYIGQYWGRDCIQKAVPQKYNIILNLFFILAPPSPVELVH